MSPSASVSVPSAKSPFFPSLLDAHAAIWRGDDLYEEGCEDTGRWGRIVITPSHNFTNCLFIGDWRAAHGALWVFQARAFIYY